MSNINTQKHPTAVAPVTVLVGQEQLLVDDAMQHIRRATLSVLPDLNQQRVDLAEQPLSELLEAARTLPMMAPLRLVVGHKLDKLQARDHAALLHYLSSPCATTVLVLTAAKADLRSTLWQAIKEQKLMTLLDLPRGQKLVDWVMQRARGMGIAMTHRAATRLAELVGQELGVLVMSLEKLKLYVGEETSVDLDHVDIMVSRTHEASIFELTGALGRRDWPTATTRLQQLLQHGEAPLRVLSMVAREVRLLLCAKEGVQRPSDVAEILGVRPFVAERLLKDAKHFALDELFSALRATERCDAALKSSAMKPDLLLQRLLLQLCVG